jgi:hypothetical protein
MATDHNRPPHNGGGHDGNGGGTGHGDHGKNGRDTPDFSRIKGMDPAANWLLGPALQTFLGESPEAVPIPFLMVLDDPKTRALFDALPPLEGREGNGALVIGGPEVDRLTGGKVVVALAPLAWFRRLATDAADDSERLRSFRDAQKSIHISSPATLPFTFDNLSELLESSVLPLPENTAPFDSKDGTVVMGIIDDGIAFAHERLRDGEGKSRVHFFWDQNPLHRIFSSPGGVLPFPLLDLPGELDKSEIDAHLPGLPARIDEDELYQATGALDFRDRRTRILARRLSHGAHVGDLAAGYHPSQDIGRRRPVIGVQLPSPVIARPVDDYRLDFYIWLGILYIVMRADQLAGGFNVLPVVINASFGKTAGPHDGNGELERAIDLLIEVRNNKTQVVLPAGNQHLSRCRASVDLSTNGLVDFDWIVLPDDRTFSTVQVWLPEWDGDAADRITLEVGLPDGTVFALSENGAPATTALPKQKIFCLGEEVGMIHAAENSAGRRVIRIDIGPTMRHEPSLGALGLAPAGRWKLKFRAGDAELGGQAHVWSQRDDSLFGYPQAGRQSFFDHPAYRREAETIDLATMFRDSPLIDDDTHPGQAGSPCPVTRGSLLNAIASGDHPLVAGAYTQADCRVTSYSAGGPRTPAAGAPPSVPGRPDALFPAEDSRVLGGILAAGSRSGAMVAQGGTSVAAPQLARFVADLMARQGSASRQDVRDALEAAATCTAATGYAPPDRIGVGNLPRQGPVPPIAIARR